MREGGGGPARSEMEPGKACDVQSRRLFTLSAQSLVKHPLNGDEASDQGHQCSETALTGETMFHCEFVHPRDANH
jgi:hypothetical protein